MAQIRATISSTNDFRSLQTMMLGGETIEAIIFIANINMFNMSDLEDVLPLGWNATNNTCTPFTGTVYGNKHTLFNINLTTTHSGGAGLFCGLAGATVINLELDTSCHFEGTTSGALCVEADDQVVVANVGSWATVVGSVQAGGLVGSCTGPLGPQVVNSVVAGNTTCTNNNNNNSSLVGCGWGVAPFVHNSTSVVMLGWVLHASQSPTTTTSRHELWQNNTQTQQQQEVVANFVANHTLTPTPTTTSTSTSGVVEEEEEVKEVVVVVGVVDEGVGFVVVDARCTPPVPFNTNNASSTSSGTDEVMVCGAQVDKVLNTMALAHNNHPNTTTSTQWKAWDAMLHLVDQLQVTIGQPLATNTTTTHVQLGTPLHTLLPQLPDNNTHLVDAMPGPPLGGQAAQPQLWLLAPRNEVLNTSSPVVHTMFVAVCHQVCVVGAVVADPAAPGAVGAAAGAGWVFVEHGTPVGTSWWVAHTLATNNNSLVGLVCDGLLGTCQPLASAGPVNHNSVTLVLMHTRTDTNTTGNIYLVFDGVVTAEQVVISLVELMGGQVGVVSVVVTTDPAGQLTQVVVKVQGDATEVVAKLEGELANKDTCQAGTLCRALDVTQQLSPSPDLATTWPNPAGTLFAAWLLLSRWLVR